jgi:hypothetical protein
MGRLKSGCSLDRGLINTTQGVKGVSLLDLSVGLSPELSSLLGNVVPQTAFSTYRAGAFNVEADEICRFGRWREVNVVVGDVGLALIGQWQEVNIGRRRQSRWSHCGDLCDGY